jgi:hypothetical protein
MPVVDRTVDQLAFIEAQISEACTLEEVSALYLSKLRVQDTIRGMEEELNRLSRGWSIAQPKRTPITRKRQPVTSAK